MYVCALHGRSKMKSVDEVRSFILWSKYNNGKKIAELSPFYKNIRLHLKRSSCVIYIFKHTELFWRKQTSSLPSWLTTLFNGRVVIFHLTLLTLFARTRKALRRIPTAWKVFVFGVILVRIFPHSDQNNSEYGHFLGSAPSLMNLMT